MGRPRGPSLIGQTFNYLKVLDQKSECKSVYLFCECRCGNKKWIRKDCVLGETKSCGCYRRSQEHPSNGNDEWNKDGRGRLLARARTRAMRDNREFSIVKEDIVIPEVCPLLGIEIRIGAKDRHHSPSLDRKDNTKGYTPDNIWVVSSRANTLKNNGTLEEFRMLVENWDLTQG